MMLFFVYLICSTCSLLLSVLLIIYRAVSPQVYAVLEEAMESGTGPGVDTIYRFNKANQHKMQPIPTFKL